MDSKKTRRGGGGNKPKDTPMDIGEIKTDFAAMLRKNLQSIRQKSKNVKSGGIEIFTDGEKCLNLAESLIVEIDKMLKDQKPGDFGKGAKITAKQATAQLKELESEIGDAMNLNSMRSELQGQLSKALDREAFSWFNMEAIKLKDEIISKRDILAKEINILKSSQAELGIRTKIAAIKGVDISFVNNIPIKSEEVSIMPQAIKEVLFHPVWLSRKFEKEWGVIIERPTGRHVKIDGCVITGLAKDVDVAISRLENFNVSGKKVLTIDGRSIASALSKASDIEKKTNVVMFAPPNGGALTILGSEDSVNKAVSMLGNVKEVEASSLISDSLKMPFLVAKALQSEVLGEGGRIEKEFGVTISVTPADSGHLLVFVKGAPEGVAKAINESRKFQESLFVEEIKVNDPDACALLFEGSKGAKLGFGEARVFGKFSATRREANVFITRGSSGSGFSNKLICIAGLSSESVEKASAVTIDCLQKVKYSTERVELQREHNRCWSEKVCKVVSERSGAELYFRKAEVGNNHLEFWGSDESKRKAKALIDEVHFPLEVVVADDVIKALLESRAQALIDLQEEASVHMAIAKFDKKVFIFGTSDKKVVGKNCLNKFVNRVAETLSHLTIKEIDLRQEEVGLVIGPKGRTIKKLKDDSKCDDIRIDVKKVVITGTAEATEAALLAIEELLASKKEAATLQGQPDEAEESGIRLLGGTGGWVVEKEPEIPKKIEIDSFEAFPALGALLANKANKKGRK